MMIRLWLILFAIWILASSNANAAGNAFDILIRHGRIVDGTGNPWFRGDVAITDGRIVKVGLVAGTGDIEIDATGLVVAPGFIDIHSHSDLKLLQGRVRSKQDSTGGHHRDPWRRQFGRPAAESTVPAGIHRQWRNEDLVDTWRIL